MSYFYNNKLYTYYELNETSVGSNEITKDAIEIINNEEILFDFTNLMVQTESYSVLNFSDVETIKIRIDWGDGTIDRLVIPLVSNKSTIGTYRPNQWKIVKHLFNVSKRYEYKTDNEKFFHKITVTAYNSFNDKLVVHIPYKMVYKTLYDLGSELSLFSSNTTNTNTVSYTLKQLSSDSMFVVNSRDWRTIYGDDETEEVIETVASIFSDEFANEDMMVWDWNSSPVVSLSVTHSTNLISGSFIQKGIAVEEWEASVIYIKDEGNEEILTQKGEGLTFQTALGSNESLSAGIYEVSINPMIGINGVKGSSDKTYVLYGTSTKPRALRCQESVAPISIENNKFYFNYALPAYGQIKTLTKAQLYLSAEFEDEKYSNIDISDINFSYDLLAPLKDEEGNPTTTNTKFQYVIPMRNIPSVAKPDPESEETAKIRYVPKIITNDVLGGIDNYTFYNDTGSASYNLSNDKLSFGNYDIGNFVGGISISSTNAETNKVNVNWTFNKGDDWDEFRFKLTSKVNNSVIYNNVHEFRSENSFDGLSSESVTGGIKFTKVIDGNLIPDGDYTINLDYVVEMGDYYDVRKKSISKTETFTYVTPNITITDVRFVPVINYDRVKDTQTISLTTITTASEAKNRKFKQITSYLNGNSTGNLSNLTFNTNVTLGSGDTTQHKYKISAIDQNDKFNRVGTSEEVTCSVDNQDIKNNLFTLPNNGVDYLQGNTSTQFTYRVGSQDEVRSWLWVKENTLHDIRKLYSYTYNGVTYFTANDSAKCLFGSSKRCPLYYPIELKTGNKTYRRFIPYTGDKQAQIVASTRTSLPNANTVLPSSSMKTNTSYLTTVDSGQLMITWNSPNNLTTAHVKDAWLYLKNTTTGKTQEIDVKGLKTYTFTDLDFGDYEYYFVINSEYNSSDANTTSKRTVKIFVPNNQSVVHVGSPTIEAGNSDTTKYVTFRWKLNHTSCEDVRFYYTVNGKTTYVDYVKLQNFTQTPALSVGSKITYGFQVKSSALESQEGATNDGWVTVNEKSITIPSE